MTSSDKPLVEGILAIDKPSGTSSGQVVRDLQNIFGTSELFDPWLKANRKQRELGGQTQRRKRRARDEKVKIGHGGTLDPMATGVMIIGIGKGTKHLPKFLECTKTYEATVLFGAATDSYDTEGKILKRAPYDHVSRNDVESALSQFRGKIMQMPPLYSALKMNGKRLCDYAREGREIPREIVSRPVEVKELEILSWLDGDSHDFAVGGEEADETSQNIAKVVLEDTQASSDPAVGSGEKADTNLKRKRPIAEFVDESVKARRRASTDEETASNMLMSGALQCAPNSDGDAENKLASTSPPAVKLRMTVSSGFYVRSLAHDLGKAVRSLACMCKLTRTRQGQRELRKNVLDFADLQKDESFWAPKFQQVLQEMD